MRGGSTTKSLTGSRLGWVLRFSAAAVVVMLGANLLVVAAERRLPDPLRYYSDRVQTLVTQMDRLKAAGVRSDLVFAGTSQAGRGIDPRVVGQTLGWKWTGNVAVPGTQAPITKRWLLEEVEPRLHPRRVVWAASSIDFNGGRPDPGIGRYNAAVATRRGALGEADEIFQNDVPVARHRSQLRNPYKLGTALQDGKPPTPPQQPLSALLGPTFRAPTTFGGAAAELGYMRSTLLGNFRVTREYLDAFRTTLEQLHRDGVETALVIMPVSTQFREAHPKGAEQYEAWKRLATRTATAAGANVLDLSRTEPDTAFSDFVHLNPDAARSWSALLAQRLAGIGWSKQAP
ncbi:MAG: hypothetical protein ACXVJW_04230 [Acidimicrobiia bacterium]